MTERFANVETMVEFVKKYTPCINGETTMECVERSIRNAPTIEAKPVVHAHWELFGKDGTDTDYGCTNCGYTFTTSGNYPQIAHYCPYCGASMDEEVKE